MRTLFLRVTGVSILLILVLPSPALANAGTPLLWAGMAHLLIGNFLIGAIEGHLLARLWNISVRRAVGVMTLANFVSMGAGLLLDHITLEPAAQHLMGDAPLYRAPAVLVLMGGLTIALTVLIEWPFCIWLLAGRKRQVRTALRASIVAQAVSYALLVPFYLVASNVSLYRNLQVDPSLFFVSQPRATVYFISVEDGDVYSVLTDGSRLHKVVDASITDQDARLVSRRQKANQWDLWAVVGSDGEQQVRLLQGLPGQASRSNSRYSDGKETGTWFNFGPARELAGKAPSEWKVETGFWAWEGLRATCGKTGAEVEVAMETPFVTWISRSATTLPGDQVVYQLGDQIVILDLPTRRIGLIARGRGPVVIREGEE